VLLGPPSGTGVLLPGAVPPSGRGVVVLGCPDSGSLSAAAVVFPVGSLSLSGSPSGDALRRRE